MNRQEQLTIIQEFDTKLIEVLKSKGEDYANTEDVLGNFKRLSIAATALGVNLETPRGYALFMVLLKIDRINNLLNNNKEPNNEGIEDSFGDGINYLKLAYCCYKEEKDGKNV